MVKVSSAALRTGQVRNRSARGRSEKVIKSSRLSLATLAALIAVSAYGGAAGLITGFLNLGHTTTVRLPLHSPVLGGVALTVAVAVPCTALAWLAARADRRTAGAAMACGMLLIGWILVELVFIRELSLFHPAYLVLGFLLIILGLRSRTGVRIDQRV